MNAKKRPPFDPFDPSLHPTRKVESMSSIAAELLLREHDGEFEDRSGRRLRSDRPGAIEAYVDPAWQSQPLRISAPPPPPSFATHAPAVAYPHSSRAARIVLLVGGALLLVALSVTVTLLVSR